MKNTIEFWQIIFSFGFIDAICLGISILVVIMAPVVAVAAVCAFITRDH